MCIYFVISNKTLSEWTWRVVDENGEAVARSARQFPNRPDCIKDAEHFRDIIGNAPFYDKAGVPIDPMHLSKSVSPLPMIKVKHEE
ncbi:MULTISPECIES: hypothetical protein [Klebsiella pneumoniae complex]|uniref:hypothetical protein n=1 Tax=Klebsiella pneumoniae complex TaxID=3390273 RepID=UPI000D7450B9|nr:MULTISPECIES: hypothetical protein [Klebsiella]MBK2732064.1 hypothetical protein [Klebsiella pneumoniae]HDH0806967.1 hypothetical protein [Klebsiella variicola subsp. variicola]MDQ4637144.1 hypothetical protein [Klebsiella quasipneumoniae subsp. similipneumoniae]PXL58339.1 hypothetical protein DMS35_06870 [Klebsiella variicola]HDS8530917.1 hypothetical protein [Klebsiella variicola]